MKCVKKKKGFTIVELLIIIGIIIIIISIGTPIVYGMLRNSTKSADEAQADIMTNVLEDWVVDYTNFKIKVRDGTEGYIEDVTSEKIERVLKAGVVGQDLSGYPKLVKYMKDEIELTSEVLLDFENILLNDNLYPISYQSLKAILNNYLEDRNDLLIPQTVEYSFYYVPVKGRLVINKSDATKQMIQEQIDNYILTDSDVVIRIYGENSEILV